MTAYVALVRGVNVGGKKLTSASFMAACESLGFADVKTYINSGNAVFRSKKKVDPKKIEAAIDVDARVIVRTAAELRAAIEANPFPEEAERDPSHLLITFLSNPPDEKGLALLRAHAGPEKLHIGVRELYIHFASGMAESKLNASLTERKIGAAATGRNWNTVNALLRLAEELER